MNYDLPMHTGCQVQWWHCRELWSCKEIWKEGVWLWLYCLLDNNCFLHYCFCMPHLWALSWSIGILAIGIPVGLAVDADRNVECWFWEFDYTNSKHCIESWYGHADWAHKSNNNEWYSWLLPCYAYCGIVLLHSCMCTYIYILHVLYLQNHFCTPTGITNMRLMWQWYHTSVCRG